MTTRAAQVPPPSPRSRYAGVLLACVSFGCEPELVVGAWSCPPPAPASDGGVVPALDKVVEVPWSTGFEQGFCDYQRIGGFCYSAPSATLEVIDAPVRSGQYAAQFSVVGDAAANAGQARCFREGTLPVEARYGAWFYIPVAATNTGNWNLMYFQGGAPNDLHGLWDVSLASADDGSLSLYVFDHLGSGRRDTDPFTPAVPIAAWFHIEVRLRRAADATGEIALYQDGDNVLELTNVTTDDTTFGQWYVGNLANALTPAESSIYVDDVTITPP